MICIVDYGAGNLKSVENMLRKLGVESRISSEPSDIESADKLILPGVGNFGYAMKSLQERELIEPLNRFALVTKRPVLGICLGAQLIGRGSEESKVSDGLGWLDMYCHKFPSDRSIRVPQMSWNDLIIVRDDVLFTGQDNASRFYFVHSYYMKCNDKEQVLAEAEYGIRYACVVRKQNIYGTQFHPEKSHRYGMALLRSFANIV